MNMTGGRRSVAMVSHRSRRGGSSLARSALRSCLVIALLCASGCGFKLMFPTYSYTQLNSANPVRSVKKLHLSAVDWQSARIDDTEQVAWLATLSPAQQASFREDMRRFEVGMHEGADRFHERFSPQITLVSEPSADAYSLAVKVVAIRMGWWAGLFSGATFIDYAAELKDPGGQVVESFTSREVIPNGYSSGERIEIGGRSIGIALEHYLKARNRGQTQGGQ